MKKTVKIAYWDTEQGANPPKLIGQIKGTPTVKFIIPSKKNKKNSNTKKKVLDYSGAREYKPMKEFAESSMPSYVENINGQKSLDAFLAKADKYGLPRALVFSKKARSATIKGLSTEFRRKLLIGEIAGTSNNKAILDKYNIKDMPKVLVLKDDGEPILLEKKSTYNALNFFFSKHALKKPTDGPKKASESPPESSPEEKAEL